MSLRKREYLPQKIRKKDPGQIECVTGMFFLLMLLIMLYTQIQLATWQASAAYLEDALAASNLAAALVDVEEYGKSHKLRISDAGTAYSIFLDAVKENLQLDDQWECRNKALIAGPVEIADFVIYNVDQNNVSAVRLNERGLEEERWTGIKGQMRAPNNVLVESTGIYSEIRFPVEGFLGVSVQAHKGKLIDIMSVKGERNEIK